MDNRNLPFYSLVKAGFITGISLILGMLFDYFFYGKIPGISFPLYILLVIVGFFALAIFLKRQINKQVNWLLFLLMFFSGMVFVRSSGLLTFLNVVCSLSLLFVIAEISSGEKIKNFGPLFQTISDLFSFRWLNKRQQVLSPVVKGIGMAIPVLFIFLLLFSSSDLIFQKYLSYLIAIDIKPEIVLRLFLIIIATFGCIGMYSYMFRKTEKVLTIAQTNKSYTVGYIESFILFGSVNTLFFIFILIQLTYLFGGANNISAQGFTYAEYARRGFFELIAVAIISLLLLLTTEKYIAKKETEHTRGFKVLSSLLVVQVIVIMASAFTRLLLYEKAYGFTTLRLYSHACIILLAVIFFLLLRKIYKDKSENIFAFRLFIVMLLFLVVMNFLNPDAFIARQNIERFATTGKIDIYYLSRLSEDAVPDTIKLLDILDEDLKKSFARELSQRFQSRINSPYFSKWQSLNLSRIYVDDLFNSRIREFEPYLRYQVGIASSDNFAKNSAVVKIVRVIDGDTIEIEGGEKIRYIGIDAPESVDPRKTAQCFGREASRKNKALVEGKMARLEKDITDRDKYHRLLRYVWVGATFVNLELVKEGFAYSYSYPPDIKYQDIFIQAQREAQSAKRGLWSRCSH